MRQIFKLGTVLLVSAVFLGAPLIHGQQPPVQGGKPGRLNETINLLEQGKVVFGVLGQHSIEWAEEARLNPDIDFAFYDMEHYPFDINDMRLFLQFFSYDPGRIAKAGRPVFKPTVVRAPFRGREMNEWMIQHILDQGAHGLSVPQNNTLEEIQHQIRAFRFPQPVGKPYTLPEGVRGVGGSNDSHLWGLTGAEYHLKADTWPLNPDGELIYMPMAESRFFVEHAREIVGTPGISMLFVGPGDLGNSYGGDKVKLEAGIQTLLSACKEFKVPCAITASPNDVEKRIKEGFRGILTGSASGAGAETLRIGHRAAGRETAPAAPAGVEGR